MKKLIVTLFIILCIFAVAGCAPLSTGTTTIYTPSNGTLVTPTITVTQTITAPQSSTFTLSPTTPTMPQNTANDIVYITRTGSKYHRANCRYLSQSKIPIERSIAISQGYTPCSVCKP